MYVSSFVSWCRYDRIVADTGDHYMVPESGLKAVSADFAPTNKAALLNRK
jgi:hypothetical protein